MRKILFSAAVLLAVCFAAHAQTEYAGTEVETYVDPEYELYEMDEDEYALEFGLGENTGFGVYGGEYYLTGYRDKTGTSRETDFNDKFHLGLQYTLINDDFVTILVKYEQTSFWEMYQYARPISETIYAPGVELAFKMKQNSRLVFGLDMQFNGASDEFARRLTYGRVALYRDFPLKRGAMVSAALQGAFGYSFDGEESSIRDFYRYNGYFTAGAWFQSADENFKCRLKVSPYDYFNHCGIQLDIHYRPSYSLWDNVYYMIQYGYGLEQQHQFLPEGTPLQPRHYIRFGLSLCPEFVL